MSDTKEAILNAALRLFARAGYEAVSVSDISGALGMSKGALYRHFQSKRDILDSILRRMRENDRDRAEQYGMPGEEDMAAGRPNAPLEEIRRYAKAQFRYWTEEPFSSDFRRLLTLEQYRDKEMSDLYQQYIASGPLAYMAEIFTETSGSAEEGERMALAFYAPMHLLYSAYDGAADKKAVLAMLDRYIDRFIDEQETPCPRGEDRRGQTSAKGD